MDNQDSLFCDIISHYSNYVFNPIDPPDGSNNHKAFSVYSNLDTIWVGTAGGVNKGVVQKEENENDEEDKPKKKKRFFFF